MRGPDLAAAQSKRKEAYEATSTGTGNHAYIFSSVAFTYEQYL